MELRELAQRAPVQPVCLPELERHGVALSVWRLDLIDAAAPGNKLFKLWENLRAAREGGHRRVLSFGGAFSNHLHALALSGAAAGLETVGVVRGEPAAAANPTLQDAQRAGMLLHFVDRATYRRRAEPVLLRELQRRFGDCYVIPEGGANRLGVLGCRIIGGLIRTWPRPPDVVALACGTGSTLAGVAAGLEGCSEALGVAVLKGGEFLNAAVRDQLRAVGADDCRRWRIDTRHHGGGYARVTPALHQFVTEFTGRSGIAVEPVYTGKLLYALCMGITRGEFAPGTRLLALHTGGMQGWRDRAGQTGRGARRIGDLVEQR